MSLSLFTLKKDTEHLIKTQHANIKSIVRSHVACDLGYDHLYGQGLWKWWNNTFLEWSWAFLFVLLLKETSQRIQEQKARCLPVCHSNILATVRTHSLVCHEFKNGYKYLGNARVKSIWKHFSHPCILFLLKEENARKQASHPTPTYRSFIWLHGWWKKS